MKSLNKFDPEGKLLKRVLSAALLAPIALLILFVGGVVFKLAIAILTFVMVAEAYNMCTSSLQNNNQKFKFFAGVCLLILLPMLEFKGLRIHNEDGLLLSTWLLISVWASDVAAYFVGLKVGGPKLAPSISPKKTWAGFAGACFSTIVIGLIFSFFYHDATINFGIAGLFLGAVAQAGDLVESKVKRIFNVKDSGNIIPGHGGLLDRADSLLAASLYISIYLYFAQ